MRYPVSGQWAASTKCITKYSVDPAKYLFIRLSLRKTDQWLKLADLRYESELGQAGIVEAMKELCRAPKQPSTQIVASTHLHVHANEGPEIIDLTIDEEEAAVVPIGLGDQHPPMKSETEGEMQERKPDYTCMAHGIDDADNLDLLYCLNMDDLRDLIKKMKLSCKENRACIPSHVYAFIAYIACLARGYD